MRPGHISRGLSVQGGVLLYCRRTTGSNSRLKYERGPSASLHPVCAYHSLPWARPRRLAVKRRGDLVAVATGWLVLVVPVDPARRDRFSRSVIAERVRGR